MDIYEWVNTLPIKYLSHHVINSSYSLFTLGKQKKPTNDVISGTPQFYRKSNERRRKYMNQTYCTKVYTMLNKIYLLRILEMVKFKV